MPLVSQLLAWLAFLFLNILSSTLLLARRFVDQALVNVRDDTAAGDRGLDEGVQFLVSANGQLQVAGGDALDLQIFARVAGQFQHFGGQVLEDGRRVHGGGGAHAVALVDRVLEEAVDAADGKLQTGLGRARLRRLLRGGGLAALSSLAAFASFSTLLYNVIGFHISKRCNTIIISQSVVQSGDNNTPPACRHERGSRGFRGTKAKQGKRRWGPPHSTMVLFSEQHVLHFSGRTCVQYQP